MKKPLKFYQRGYLVILSDLQYAIQSRKHFVKFHVIGTSIYWFTSYVKIFHDMAFLKARAKVSTFSVQACQDPAQVLTNKIMRFTIKIIIITCICCLTRLTFRFPELVRDLNHVPISPKN